LTLTHFLLLHSRLYKNRVARSPLSFLSCCRANNIHRGSQVQVMAMAFRSKALKPSKCFPLRSEATSWFSSTRKSTRSVLHRSRFYARGCISQSLDYCPVIDSGLVGWWGLTRTEDALFWDRPRAVYHRLYFSIRSETRQRPALQFPLRMSRQGHTMYRGTSLIRSCAPQDPSVGLYLGPYSGPGGGAVSYERDIPVLLSLVSVPETDGIRVECRVRFE
jgi:hypothetical protein